MGEQQENCDLVPKPWVKRWYVVDLMLFGGFAVAYAAFFGFMALSSYMDGRSGGRDIFSSLCVLPVMGCILLLWLFLLPVQIVLGWPKHVKSRRKLVVLYLLVSLGLVVWIALPFTGLWPPGYEMFTDGFGHYLRAEMDLAAVRDWLSSLDPRTYDGQHFDLSVRSGLGTSWPDRIAWPAAITRFDPHYVQFNKTEAGRLKIRLTWGGALGHWGVEIGPQDMEIPPSQERQREKVGPPGHESWFDGTGEYRLPLAPGAYVWHEIQ